MSSINGVSSSSSPYVSRPAEEPPQQSPGVSSETASASATQDAGGTEAKSTGAAETKATGTAEARPGGNPDPTSRRVDKFDREAGAAEKYGAKLRGEAKKKTAKAGEPEK